MTSVKDRIAALQKQAQTKPGEGVSSRTPNTSWKKPTTTPSHSTPIKNSSYNHGRKYAPHSSPSPKIENSRLTIPVASRLSGMNMSSTNTNTDDTNTNSNTHIPQSIKSRSSNKVSKLADKLKGMNVNLHPMGMPMRVGTGKPQPPHQEPESGDNNNSNARGEKKSVQFRRAMIAPGQRRPRTIRRTLQGIKLSTE